MRAPRSVTFAPTAIPSRSLKLAIDLRALRTCARWPAMIVSSSIAASSALASVFASPTPMFSVIFAISRHLHDRAQAELLLQLRAQLESSAPSGAGV